MRIYKIARYVYYFELKTDFFYLYCLIVTVFVFETFKLKHQTSYTKYALMLINTKRL